MLKLALVFFLVGLIAALLGFTGIAAGAALTASITAPLLGIGVAAVTASTALNEKMANVASLGIATDQSVLRSRVAARSSRRVSR